MGLSRRAYVGSFYDKVEVNVFDISTKKIVFSGSQGNAANFLSVHQGVIATALKTRGRIKKQYAVRIKKDNHQPHQ